MSNFLNNFKEHAVLEVNKSVALRTGDMIADIAFNQPATGAAKDYIDNGLLFTLELDGTVKLANKDTVRPLYIHYTEELLTVQFLESLKYFTVDYNNKKQAYPRLLKVIIGDVYTTDTFEMGAITDVTKIKYASIGTDGLVVVSATEPAKGHIFAAKATTSPSGKKTAVELTYVGQKAVTA